MFVGEAGIDRAYIGVLCDDASEDTARFLSRSCY